MLDPGFFDCVYSQRGTSFGDFIESCFYLDGISGSLGTRKFQRINPDQDTVKELKSKNIACSDCILTGFKIIGLILFSPVLLIGKAINRSGHNYKVSSDNPPASGRVSDAAAAAAVTSARPNVVATPAVDSILTLLVTAQKTYQIRQEYEKLTLAEKKELYSRLASKDHFEKLFITAGVKYDKDIMDAVLKEKPYDDFASYAVNLYNFLKKRKYLPAPSLFDLKPKIEERRYRVLCEEAENESLFSGNDCASVDEVVRRVSRGDLGSYDFEKRFKALKIETKIEFMCKGNTALLGKIANFESENYQECVRSVIEKEDNLRDNRILAMLIGNNDRIEDTPLRNLRKCLQFREEFNKMPSQEQARIKQKMKPEMLKIFDAPFELENGKIKSKGLNAGHIANLLPEWMFEVISMLPSLPEDDVVKTMIHNTSHIPYSHLRIVIYLVKLTLKAEKKDKLDSKDLLKIANFFTGLDASKTAACNNLLQSISRRIDQTTLDENELLRPIMKKDYDKIYHV